MTPRQIKRRREKLGLSREELAARVGVSISTIYRWEQNKAKPMRFFMRQLELVLKEERKK